MASLSNMQTIDDDQHSMCCKFYKLSLTLFTLTLLSDFKENYFLRSSSPFLYNLSANTTRKNPSTYDCWVVWKVRKKYRSYAKLRSQDTSIVVVETGCVPALQLEDGK